MLKEKGFSIDIVFNVKNSSTQPQNELSNANFMHDIKKHIHQRDEFCLLDTLYTENYDVNSKDPKVKFPHFSTDDL
jgi:hypothetical protein